MTTLFELPVDHAPQPDADGAPREPVVVTKPGVYDMPLDEYHRDPVPGGSLSSTGARKLLAPSCPAKFQYEQTHGQPWKAEFDFGTAVHTFSLGSGPRVICIDAGNWTTSAAKAQRDEAHARGMVPLLNKDYERAKDVARAIRNHPVAAALLRPDRGVAEQSLFWRDPVTGVWLRARPDWRTESAEGRCLIVDVKTTESAAPEDFSRSIAKFGYHQQGDQYREGVQSLGLGEDPEFLMIAVEKQPPYVTQVYAMDRFTLSLGAARNRRARELFRDCMRSGRWPAYTDEIAYLSLPPWAERSDTEEYT